MDLIARIRQWLRPRPKKNPTRYLKLGADQFIQNFNGRHLILTDCEIRIGDRVLCPDKSTREIEAFSLLQPAPWSVNAYKHAYLARTKIV